MNKNLNVVIILTVDLYKSVDTHTHTELYLVQWNINAFLGTF